MTGNGEALRFDQVITTREQLRAIIPPAKGPAEHKVIDHIDPICRRYIKASPFVLIATRGRGGALDVSPKGDPAGFVHVLDDHTLAIPDRPGNNRLDGFENLLEDPEIGLLFLIPGNGDTLRVNGIARIVADPALCDRFKVKDRAPKLVLVVTVREAFTHCPKCMIRSHLWQPDQWPDLSDVPSLAEAIKAHAQRPEQIGELKERFDRSATERLY